MDDTNVVPINETAAQASESEKGVVRTKYYLPTDRIIFRKQMDLLRAYGAASGPNRKAVKGKDVAEIVGMADTTASLASAFFTENKLVSKGEGGFIPSDAVIAFTQAHEWKPETASRELGPLLKETWFGKLMMTRLGFGPMTDTDALTVLSQEAGAGKQYEAKLKILLDYLEAGGLIVRENGSIRKAQQGPAAASPATPAAPATPDPSADGPAVTVTKGSVSTAFQKAAEGTVQFHIAVRVDMTDFKGWEADRIAAFFGGIAQVLAAKGNVETEDLT